ncbi:hypothetical protein ATANTOWER_019475 [Ataeniobius toweri]|uniref:Uncharacterized protein n=1 Tax=Ataeniobius toweri TaxID=208326 RepID=A0ABU7AHD8_9TELE|nr:hypothetical protein [Ataeniobius toweri]
MDIIHSFTLPMHTPRTTSAPTPSPNDPRPHLERGPHEFPPQRGTPPQLSSTPKSPWKHIHTVQVPHTAPLQAPLPHSASHHTVWHNGKARAPHNTTSASAHKCNRADTTELHTHS